ncbi:hypothetical protein MHPYR_120171 [uncultured Mycobacterium sp.]|uniref:Uncharacterized protein n=1 Tax=uncultured Mycobacterium sp. TaxID=171292 RepID=A0A1Y5P068_9MYCO|nr:hypothetical protein MHPYR_120171 [uncultured Mycobacterium sp.]
MTTLSQLPAITYRGMAGPRPNASFTVSGILPTSMDPRVASENFTAEWLAGSVDVPGLPVSVVLLAEPLHRVGLHSVRPLRLEGLGRHEVGGFAMNLSVPPPMSSSSVYWQ